MSKTTEDLKAAFAGESQANRRYLAFAKAAEKEGLKSVAKLFRAAAYAETVHALNHLAIIGEVKSTVENLETAVSGENFVQIVYFKSNDATAEDVYVDAVMLETGGSASAWVNYSSGTDIAVGNVGTMEIAGLNPTILAATSFTVGNVGAIEITGLNPLVSVGAGLWEIGAYIYNVLGGTQINVGNVGVIEIAGLDPTVLANTTLTVGNVGAIEIAGLNPTVDFTQAISVGNVGGIEIAGLNPTVGYTLSSNDSGIDGPRIMTVLLLRG